MGVRNVVSHLGQQDIEQPMAERALNTMELLCKEIDTDGANELHEIYKVVRARAKEPSAGYVGAAQPLTNPEQGISGGLLSLLGTDDVIRTDQSRKVTYGGKTAVYPVYRVRLDRLYYNDQNDRISTWITQYESENGEESLEEIDRDVFNRIIEGFIFESNPESIRRTQTNISSG